jgi:hypothetical protein
MSTNSSNTVSQKPATASDDSSMLTPEQVIEQLRVMRGRIPDFVHLQESRELRRIRNTIRVNVELDHESINAAGAADFVRQVIGSTPDEFRLTEDEAVRWSSAENEIRGFLRGVTAANVMRRQRIATALRRAYSVSRALVRQEQYAHLRAHVETIFRRPKSKRAKPAPPPDDQRKQ